MASTEGPKIATREIELSKLVAHPQNANRMDTETRLKLKSHVSETGKYPALVVRPHPEGGDRFEILDGHQRSKVLRLLGYKSARCEVWDVDDAGAKTLLATLNRLRGQDDPNLRAALFGSMALDLSFDPLDLELPETLADVLPDTLDEMYRLQALLADEKATAKRKSKKAPKYSTLRFRLESRDRAVVDEAIAKAGGGKTLEQQSSGLLRICRAWIDGIQDKAPE